MNIHRDRQTAAHADHNGPATRAARTVAAKMPDSEHQRPWRTNPIVSCECGCGATFRMYNRLWRPRRFVTGHNRQQLANPSANTLRVRRHRERKRTKERP